MKKIPLCFFGKNRSKIWKKHGELLCFFPREEGMVLSFVDGLLTSLVVLWELRGKKYGVKSKAN